MEICIYGYGKIKVKTILITGAAKGIGKDLVTSLSQSHKLVLIDKDRGALEDLRRDIDQVPPNHLFGFGDVSDAKFMFNYFSILKENDVKLDTVYVNAGEIDTQSENLLNIDIGAKLLNSNFLGAALTLTLVSELMKEGGSVVVITSISSLVATQNSSWYSASKAALSKYVDSYRLNFRNAFNVSEVVLGFVKTGMTDGLPHAKFLTISSNKAARAILKVGGLHSGRYSIPRFRNLIWYLLSFMPLNFQSKILSFVYSKIN